MVRLDGPTFTVPFLRKSIRKAFGPWMWTKWTDHAPKNECVEFFRNMSKNGIFEKKRKLKFDHSLVFLLASLLFTSLIYLFSLVSTLNLSKRGCNGGEEEETYFALRIIHVIVHACETCCGHSNIDFARRMRETCNFELDLWEHGT